MIKEIICGSLRRICGCILTCIDELKFKREMPAEILTYRHTELIVLSEWFFPRKKKILNFLATSLPPNFI